MSFELEWDEAWRFWGCPALDEPTVYTCPAEAEKNMGESLAFIDMQTRQISVNAPKLQQLAGLEFLPVVEKHEIGHHLVIPYDLKTFLILLERAGRVFPDKDSAHTVQNLFSDSIVNTGIYRKGDRKVAELYKHLKGTNAAWKIYLRCYEHTMGLASGTLAPSMSSEEEKDAVKLGRIVEEAISSPSKWPAKAQAYASILAKYFDSGSMPLIGNLSVASFARSMKEVADQTKGLAKDLGMKNYQRALGIGGVGGKKRASALFYADLARQYIAELPINPSSGSTPRLPSKWMPTDPVDRLDADYSMQQAGRLLPGVSTYLWKSAEKRDPGSCETPYDLTILIDCSGSMTDPCSDISYAVLSGNVLAQAALRAGSKVGGINFDSEYRVLKHTSDGMRVARWLSLYRGGGTTIPCQELADLVEEHSYPQHLVLITDGHCDMDEEYLRQAVSYSHGATALLINTDEQAGVFRSLGFDVKLLSSEEDLLSLSLKKAKEWYKC